MIWFILPIHRFLFFIRKTGNGNQYQVIVITLMMKLLETAKERGIDIAEVLISVIDARDTNLNGHSKHVQNFTMLFYQYLPNHYKRKI